MKIGPGTAPKAQIYALKVFGCDGSTNVTSQALDWSLDPDGDGDFSDHLDVVNLSLGCDYGAPDDPDSLFVKKLVQGRRHAGVLRGQRRRPLRHRRLAGQHARGADRRVHA